MAEHKNRFDGVDLGADKSLQRMARSVARQRVSIILELAQELQILGERNAAKYLQDKAASELKEVGL